MHEELVLEGALHAIGIAEVVDRRALGVDARLQRLDDRAGELVELGARQRPRRSQRVDARAEERLVGVDVADAGDPPLVEQERLDRRTPAARELSQVPAREAASNGSRPRRAAMKAAWPRDRAAARPFRTGAGHEKQLAVAEVEDHARVRRSRAGRAAASRHAQVDGQEDVVFELEDEVLAAPAETLDLRPSVAAASSAAASGRTALVEHLDAAEDAAVDVRCQAAPDRLDFGQFGQLVGRSTYPSLRWSSARPMPRTARRARSVELSGSPARPPRRCAVEHRQQLEQRVLSVGVGDVVAAADAVA